MKKILVTGASGQIGSELIPELRKLNGDENVIASVNKTPMTEEVQNSGPNTKIDVRNIDEIDSVIKKYKIDTIFHLGSILSASAETNRKLAYQVNFNGLNNILESSVTNSVKKVMLVSSIAAFASINSKRLVGTKIAFEGVFKLWFDLPTRCNNLLIPLGAPTWIIFSTSP